jgi:hypothetical protein
VHENENENKHKHKHEHEHGLEHGNVHTRSRWCLVIIGLPADTMAGTNEDALTAGMGR